MCALFHPGQHTLQRVLPCQPMARSRGEQQPGSRRTRFHTSSHLVGQASQSHVGPPRCPDSDHMSDHQPGACASPVNLD